MSAEWVAVVVAIVAVGVTGTVAIVSGSRRLDDRLRAVESELAYLRGLLQGAGFTPQQQPRGDSDQTEGAA
ncbi:MAG: hypothetical protein OXQ89_21880 [Rhodospirillaceae bacterium]|nr:hypothetical protein [Rhodospirillaceae bacterium]MDE0360754.1 hypothetical protein [Rhodospirillaceae bacterium]